MNKQLNKSKINFMIVALMSITLRASDVKRSPAASALHAMRDKENELMKSTRNYCSFPETSEKADMHCFVRDYGRFLKDSTMAFRMRINQIDEKLQIIRSRLTRLYKIKSISKTQREQIIKELEAALDLTYEKMQLIDTTYEISGAIVIIFPQISKQHLNAAYQKDYKGAEDTIIEVEKQIETEKCLLTTMK